MNDPLTTWQVIATEGVANLYKTKEQMHQAVQLVALVGRSFLPPDDEDGHANLEWLPSKAALAGQTVGEGKKYRAALHLEDLKYLIINDQNQVIISCDLVGKNQDEVFGWLRDTFNDLGFNADLMSLKLPYAIPIYPTCTGELFRIDSVLASRVISDLFANAHLELLRLQADHSNVSSVRCWPHHFDLAALIALENKQESESTKSIGIGFSPGDETIPEPYFYVNSWPYPDLTNQEPPTISGGGKWNLQGWIGTVLTYSQLLDARDQYYSTHRFFISSIKALKQLHKASV